EFAAGPMLFEVDAGLSAEVTGDQSCQRFGNYQADRLLLMTPQQRPECRLDSLHGLLDGLTLGRTDGCGAVDPLAGPLGSPAPEFGNLQSLPQSLVQVAKVVDPFGADSQDLTDNLGGANQILPRPGVKGRERRAAQAESQPLGHPHHLDPAALA